MFYLELKSEVEFFFYLKFFLCIANYLPRNKLLPDFNYTYCCLNNKKNNLRVLFVSIDAEDKNCE